ARGSRPAPSRAPGGGTPERDRRAGRAPRRPLLPRDAPSLDGLGRAPSRSHEYGRRPADRHRRSGKDRHDDPLRPPRAGPGAPRPAHLGGRPAAPAARARDLRDRPADRRGPSAARSRRAPDPRLPSDAPNGRPPGPGMRPHHGVRLPQHDLPDAVPRAVLRALAPRGSGHGARVSLAPALPPSAPVAPPPRALGSQIPGPRLVSRRSPRGIPERAPRPDAPRPAEDHRVARLPPRDA